MSEIPKQFETEMMDTIMSAVDRFTTDLPVSSTRHFIILWQLSTFNFELCRKRVSTSSKSLTACMNLCGIASSDRAMDLMSLMTRSPSCTCSILAIWQFSSGNLSPSKKFEYPVWNYNFTVCNLPAILLEKYICRVRVSSTQLCMYRIWGKQEIKAMSIHIKIRPAWKLVYNYFVPKIWIYIQFHSIIFSSP